MKKRLTPCPATLGVHGRRLWKNILSEFELTASERQTLEAAGCSLDMYHLCRENLAKNGMLNGAKAAPECGVMRDCLRSFLQALKSIGVDQVIETKKPVGHPVENRWTVQTGRAL